MSMIRQLFWAISCLVLLALPSTADAAEKRIALVIGNSSYAAGQLATAANDAGLIAQTLQAAGFDVVGARDLDGDSIRRSFRDFLDKAATAGPDGVAFVYLAGYGIQLEGQNYFLPVDARLDRVTDVPVEGIRLSDYLHGLAGLGLKGSVVVVDAARETPFLKSETTLAGGLALVDPEPGQLVAFNAAPGTIGPPATGAYGAYAKALAEMLRQGGLALPDVFAQVRLRVNEETKGGEVPWNAGTLATPIVLFERQADAPPAPEAYQQAATTRSKPIAEFDARDAYVAAVERDTFQGYQDFLTAYPDDAMAPRVRLILAARREAITWRRTWHRDTPQAYWSYLDRYPRGPHAGDARRRLRELRAAFEPPPTYERIEYDLPPPPPPEIVYVERPVLVFYDPEWDLPPPPPPPIIFLPPPVIIVVRPPPPPPEPYVLPIPVFTPVPRGIAPPRDIFVPTDNALLPRIHDRIEPQPAPTDLTPGQAAGAAVAVGAAAALLKVALPPSVKRRAPPPGLPAAVTPGRPDQPLVPGKPPLPGQPLVVPAPKPLPGGAPLPAADDKVIAKPAPELQPKPGLKPKPGVTPVPGAAPLPTPDEKVIAKPAPELQPKPGLKPKPELAPLPGAAPLPAPGRQRVKPAPALQPLPDQAPAPALKPLPAETLPATPNRRKRLPGQPQMPTIASPETDAPQPLPGKPIRQRPQKPAGAIVTAPAEPAPQAPAPAFVKPRVTAPAPAVVRPRPEPRVTAPAPVVVRPRAEPRIKAPAPAIVRPRVEPQVVRPAIRPAPAFQPRPAPVQPRLAPPPVRAQPAPPPAAKRAPACGQPGLPPCG